MNYSKEIEGVGTFKYEESFWTGKTKLSLDGKELEKRSKKEFYQLVDNQPVHYILKGNFLTGLKIIIGENLFTIISPITWYEILLSILPLILILVWGSSVTLCKIIPVVGGAIGGGIAGAMCFVNVFICRNEKKWWVKVLSSLGILALTFLLCAMIGLIIVSVLAK